MSKEKLKVVIETGTYCGSGAINLSHHFEVVHTIELSQAWYSHTSSILNAYNNVYCHFGDSACVLETLINKFQFPIAFYLDAHYSGGTTAFGLEEVPIFRELEVIKKRTYSDLIIIDDFRLMGLKGTCGHENHPYYPVMNFDWSNLTVDSILQSLKVNKEIYWQIDDDRLVIINNLSNIVGSKKNK